MKYLSLGITACLLLFFTAGCTPKVAEEIQEVVPEVEEEVVVEEVVEAFSSICLAYAH